MRFAPRYRHGAPWRKDALYYDAYCCETCYWDWGRGFENRHLFKHDCAQSNYDGLLKKYWKTSKIDYFAEYPEDQTDITLNEYVEQMNERTI